MPHYHTHTALSFPPHTSSHVLPHSNTNTHPITTYSATAIYPVNPQSAINTYQVNPQSATHIYHVNPQSSTYTQPVNLYSVHATYHSSSLSPDTQSPLTPNMVYTSSSHTPTSSQDTLSSFYSSPSTSSDIATTISIPFSVPAIISRAKGKSKQFLDDDEIPLAQLKKM